MHSVPVLGSDYKKVEGSVFSSSTLHAVVEQLNVFQHNFVRFQAFGAKPSLCVVPQKLEMDPSL